MSFGFNGQGFGVDEEEQKRLWLQQYLNGESGEPFRTLNGLLDSTDAGSVEPVAQPQAQDGGGFQATAPNAPVAPEAQQTADGVVQPTTSAADTSREMIENAEASRSQPTGMRQRLEQNAQEALAQAGQKKGGGLLGTLLKIGINTAMGNWLGGVGAKALGTAGDAFNKAFKIKGIGVK